MHADFEVYGGALGLMSCCLYGGAPYKSQEFNLKRGVDIVIGTPGRIKVTFYYHLHFSKKIEIHLVWTSWFMYFIVLIGFP